MISSSLAAPVQTARNFASLNFFRLGASLVTAATCCALLASPASAINILISNDDGFESANIRALYAQLKAAGHSVAISAPTQNQSGQGGHVDFLVPITPLTKATRYGTIGPGAPGIGTDPADANINYVDGTPVAATLYGLDVVASAKWGKQPDLLISGPNEGANTGHITISSGTVSNVVYGINRNVPSVAVSYGDSASRSYKTLPADPASGDPAYKVANLIVTLVAQLQKGADSSGRLLPAGVGLNVNIPTFTATCSPSSFTPSRIGFATDYAPVFYKDLSTSPLAVAAGVNVKFPGVSLVGGGIPAPSGVSLPADTNPNSEANVIAGCSVSVSAMIGATQAIGAQELAVIRQVFGR